MTRFEAVEYAIKRNHIAIMEKDGEYLTAKDTDEMKYAETCGWRYVGNPAEITKEIEQSYEVLKEMIETHPVKQTQMGAVSYLIGYKGMVDKNDWENIMLLHEQGLIDR